ncbi:MAG TPA: L-seryl-tRNA(Sec) selenium transferase [Anaerolineaceae bacterium]|nr:L-seryl-tRNA(Sec) selenium transferase [Anaerolineaceae bacterium]
MDRLTDRPMSDLRHLPAVDALLQQPEAQELMAQFGRPLLLEAVRATLAAIRTEFTRGTPIPAAAELLERAGRLAGQWLAPTLVGVINASGVILHTNLGRAPLSAAAAQAAAGLSAGYCTLEYDLQRGERGSRTVHAEELLCRITGAQAALVVNNNAAAVLLALSALARRRRVIISRTQLVEIGGGFRIPDVMAQSGARLVEIGTTNRVHLSDYETALAEPAALVLRAHSSNFRIIGFTSEPALADIAALAHRCDTPLMDDLGSGALLDTARFGLAHEPMVQESLAAGVDLVCFSGDKLLGGPQAGIIVGRADLVARLKKHPLARAVRADKLCLAALAVTLQHYLKAEAEREIPIWRMISAPLDGLERRAVDWAAALGTGRVIPGESTVGGGSLPEETLPTRLLALSSPQPNRLTARLRASSPPVIARVESDQVLCDPRTVLPEQDVALLAALRLALAGAS